MLKINDLIFRIKIEQTKNKLTKTFEFNKVNLLYWLS